MELLRVSYQLSLIHAFQYDAPSMDYLHIIILSLVQGVTEFLPISSSAHLILTPYIFEWSDQGLAFDIAVHLGTLSAVVVYFRYELLSMLRSGMHAFSEREADVDAMLLLKVMLATIPAGLAGVFWHDEIELYLREPLLIAATTIGFGLLMLLANREREDSKDEYTIGIWIAVAIGFAQVLALIPGTSRSGVTMTAAVLLGMRQGSAARFSFLLSIPLILGAGLLELMYLLKSTVSVDWTVLILGTIISAISAWFCIYLFLRLIEKIGFTPFVIYRVILGAILIYLFV